MAKKALKEMKKAGMSPQIYINHGSNDNNDNIGKKMGLDEQGEIIELNTNNGDYTDNEAYHTDVSIFPDGPIKYLWKLPPGKAETIIGHDPIRDYTLYDQRKVHEFVRYLWLGTSS